MPCGFVHHMSTQIDKYKSDLSEVDYLLSIILSKLDLWAPTLTKNQQWTDHGAHRHRPLLAPPDLQTKAAVMKAEVDAVTVGDSKTGDGGSGGNEDNGSGSNGGCTDKNNQQSTKAAVATATKMMMVTQQRQLQQ
jgi:hypothetical protein